MSSLLDLIYPRLVSPKRQPDGSIVCQCPACAREGSDLKGHNHLRIYPSGAFGCVTHAQDHDHNRIIRRLIRGGEDGDTALLDGDTEYINPDPRPEVDRVYPEEMVSRLIPDHSYWVGRGISEEVLRRVGGGVAPLDPPSKLAGRYVFPIRDDAARIVGWSGRLLQPNSFAPAWKHLVKVSRICWPWYLNGPSIKAARRVVLCESIGDSLSLDTVGIHLWLTLLGLNLNGRILSHLVAAAPERIYISTNNDTLGKAESKEAGNRAAEKIKGKLLSFFNEETVVVRLPKVSKDWNDSLRTEGGRADLAAFKAEVLG